MPLIQKRKKLNDFRFGSTTIYRGNDPRRAVLDKHSGVLIETWDGHDRYYQDVSKRDNKVYVYHIEKKRPRFKQVNRSSTKGNLRTTQSKKIHDGHWIIRLFEFDKNEIDWIKQHRRHFEVRLK